MSRRWRQAQPLAVLSVGAPLLAACDGTVQMSLRSGPAGASQGFTTQEPVAASFGTRVTVGGPQAQAVVKEALGG